MIRVAGIIWIVIGGLILLNGTGSVILNLSAAENKPSGSAYAVGSLCGYAFLVFCGGVFIHVGVQSLRGTAADTLGNGIGSIIFGVINIVVAGGLILATASTGVSSSVAAIVILIFGIIFGGSGAGLILAGIMALIGREDYKAWRRSMTPRSRRRRRRNYDEDDD
jgi:hypothetical protein